MTVADAAVVFAAFASLLAAFFAFITRNKVSNVERQFAVDIAELKASVKSQRDSITFLQDLIIKNGQRRE